MPRWFCCRGSNAVYDEEELHEASAISFRKESSSVGSALTKASGLILKLLDGSRDPQSPLQALKKTLSIICQDVGATFAILHVISDDAKFYFLVGSVGLPPDLYQKHNMQLRLLDDTKKTSLGNLVKTPVLCLVWQESERESPQFSDWDELAQATDCKGISAAPIRRSGACNAAVLTLGFQDRKGAYKYHTWRNYHQLAAVAIWGRVRETGALQVVALLAEMRRCSSIDEAMGALLRHLKQLVGRPDDPHLWFRVALVNKVVNSDSATIFDNISQVSSHLRRMSTKKIMDSHMEMRQVEDGQVLRTVCPLTNTIMHLAIQNAQQFTIPDVQKLVNQSYNASVDLFNTPLLKPPVSVLLIPMRDKTHIYSSVFCMSSVYSVFSDVSGRLRDVCSMLGPSLWETLESHFPQELLELDQMPEVLDEPPSIPLSPMSRGTNSITTQLEHNTRMNAIRDAIGSFTGSFTGKSTSTTLAPARSSQSLTQRSFTQRRNGSTSALVTGLTEKINTKKTTQTMQLSKSEALQQLVVTGLLAEGGFGRVFRGMWLGMTVAVKVVGEDARDHGRVVKNAHELSLLLSLSHPNIIQAHQCIADVSVDEVRNTCMRNVPNQDVLLKDVRESCQSLPDPTCHVEILEYCDRGTLSQAIRSKAFHVLLGPAPDSSTAPGVSMPTAEPQEVEVVINMRFVLLTLIEIANAMCYLHRLGVVHCDVKPANILLKSSSMDPRGFICKVSDFGLSRVEDDGGSLGFPSNSVGTLSYMAPEALSGSSSVNNAVDIYSFGIVMWELYTGKRPYANLKGKQLLETVVEKGERPEFPAHVPAAYARLTRACWEGEPTSRPNFEAVVADLYTMLCSCRT